MSFDEEIEVPCIAPLCSKKVKVKRRDLYFMKLKSLLKGGSFTAALFCPEHDERVNKVDDGDPNTNPDLNKDQDLINLLKDATKKDTPNG